VLWRGRTNVFDGSLTGAAGAAYPLAAGETLRFQLGREGAAPALDLLAGTPAAGGSALTVTGRGAAGPPATAATYEVAVTADDLDGLAAGVYAAELLHVPSGAGPTVVEWGVAHVLDSLGGAT
jgi:hypothetical protein